MPGTLTGTYLRPDGTPREGTVSIAPSAVVRDETGNVIMSGPVKAELDETGSFSVEIAASDDDTLDPTGVTYRVSGHGPAARAIPTVIGVFIPDGGTVDMADVTPVDPAAPTYALQVSRAEFDALADDVAAGGGGGGGAVDSVNGQTGVVVLAASDVGAQPSDSDLTAIAALTTTPYGRALLALADAAAGRTAFGLGTAATAATGDFDAAGAASTAQAAAIAASLQRASNLSDLANAASARSNLGLGTAATHAHSDYDAAGAATAAQTAAAGYTDTAVAGEASARATAITTAINNLIASAPGTLDTLDELAAALGDDPNFATTITTALAGKQPLDSDLTAIAALTTTTFGRSLLALTDAAAGRTALGLGTAATTAATAYDVAGAAAAAQAASQPLDSDLTAIAALTTTSYGRAFLALADAAAGRTALGLGTAALSATGDFQPIDSDLTAIAALTTTSYGRAFLAMADAAAAKTALSLVKGDVGLGNVDNTSDANKPVSTATQTALDAKAPLVEPVNTVATSGTTQTLPDPSVTPKSRITLTASCAITLPAAIAGKSFTLMTVQNGAGGWTVSFVGAGSDVIRYSNDITPVATSAANKKDTWSGDCYSTGTWIIYRTGVNYS